MALKYFIILAIVSFVNAQFPSFGSCPEPQAVENFKLDDFLGKWYEYERYYTYQDAATTCSRIDYKKTQDGRIIASNNLRMRITGTNRTYHGELRLTEPASNKGKLTIRYEQQALVPITSTYSVIALESKKYAILWSCYNAVPLIMHVENAWFMTRDKYPSKEVVDEARAILDKIGIRAGYLHRVDQSCDDPKPTTTAPEVAPPGERVKTVAIADEQVVKVEEKVPEPVVPVAAAAVVDEVKRVDEAVVEEVKPVEVVPEVVAKPVENDVRAEPQVVKVAETVVKSEVVPEVPVKPVDDKVH